MKSRSTSRAPQKGDRRVSRTRTQLAASLRELMQQKGISDITVQEVLDRSGVSRSAFYVHYSDKVDLLLTDMDEFLQRSATQLSKSREQSERVAPVAEFFAHVGGAHHIRAALALSERLPDFFELAHEHFARGIELRLKQIRRFRESRALERSAVAHALAGAFVAQLKWWVRHGQPVSPEQMDRNFHRLVWSGIPKA
jgi:AcrR family transcriptional regulator